MTIRIAETIRAFRKGRKLTQEQLAEALGVTVGAVSKWESGASVPDVGLIVEMARFFETSVDVLLGYDWRAGGMGEAVARMKALRNEKRFDEACVEAEKALTKYPNAFDVAFYSAVLYAMKGVERQSADAYRRSLTLFERSLELIAQNTNERINDWTIRNHIAQAHLGLGDTESALEIMKKNNADDLNSGPIGYTLALDMHKPDEALPYLSTALLNGVLRLHNVAQGYAGAYREQKRYGETLEILLWIYGAISGLCRRDAPSYLVRIRLQLLAECATTSALAGDKNGARAYLRQARKLAERFDASPSYSFVQTRFFYGNPETTAFDDYGATALEGVKRFVLEDETIADAMLGLWNELEGEER